MNSRLRAKQSATYGSIALACVIACFAASSASAYDPGPTGATAPVTGATGAVNAFTAEPTVSIAVLRHCVSKTLQITPRYAGGSGLLKSYLYVNGVRAWTRSSPGPFKVAATRFRKGVSNYEVVGVFADGRSASWVGSFRRCNAKH